MEDYLNDSPADLANPQSSGNTKSSTGTPRFSYGAPFTQLDTNNFSLNLGYPDQSYNNSNLANNVTYTSPSQYNGNFSTNLNEAALSSSNSFTNDPFLDDLDNLNFPQMNQPSIEQAFDMNPQIPNQTGQVLQTLLLQIAPQDFQNQQYQFNDVNENSFNEIISPNNGVNGNSGFLNPRYFSPTNRGANFNSLNAIAEDDLGADTFSPQMHNQEYGSSFKSIPETQSALYLSPQNNNKYLSPGNFDSVDTLRSPSQSYLNSPPQYLSAGIPGINLSSSIPNHHNNQQVPKTEHSANLLSPPNTASMSMSVPTGTTLRDSVPTKLLSKEEKLKRRREFHNAVERRRRDLIKERIKELGSIVPPSLLNPQLLAVQMLQKNKNSPELEDLISSVKVKETKPNKSTILNRSVDYINHLKYVLQQQEKARASLLKLIQELQNDSGLYNPPPAPTTSTGFGGFSGLDAPTDNNPNSEFFNPDEFFLDIMKSDANGNKGSDFF